MENDDGVRGPSRASPFAYEFGLPWPVGARDKVAIILSALGALFPRQAEDNCDVRAVAAHRTRTRGLKPCALSQTRRRARLCAILPPASPPPNDAPRHQL